MNLNGINEGNIYESKVDKWERIKELVRLRLLNRDRNKELLEQLVSVAFENLAVVFYIKLDENQNNMISILVTKDLFKDLNIDIETLVKKAYENEEKYSSIKEIENTNKEIANLVHEFYKELDIVIVTNTSGKYGASSILPRKNRAELASKFGNNNCYIIPASVHNLFAVGEDVDSNKLLKLVKEANRTIVDKKDVLDDAIYLLHGDTLEIELITEKTK